MKFRSRPADALASSYTPDSDRSDSPPRRRRLLPPSVTRAVGAWRELAMLAAIVFGSATFGMTLSQYRNLPSRLDHVDSVITVTRGEVGDLRTRLDTQLCISVAEHEKHDWRACFLAPRAASPISVVPTPHVPPVWVFANDTGSNHRTYIEHAHPRTADRRRGDRLRLHPP